MKAKKTALTINGMKQTFKSLASAFKAIVTYFTQRSFFVTNCLINFNVYYKLRDCFTSAWNIQKYILGLVNNLSY